MGSSWDTWEPPKGGNGFGSGIGDTLHTSFGEAFDHQQKKVEERAAPSDMTYIQGALSSTVSAIPELFGTDALPGVEAWREQHPVADLVTNLAGMAIPYAGMAKLSTVGRGAAFLEGATEGTLKAFGTTSLKSPFVGGALKEFYRFTPLELSRLGTGYAIGADMGDMFSDVALSQTIAGALGGVGGFLRAGGNVVKRAWGQVADAEQGLLPSFELRLAQEPDSKIIGTMDRDQFIFQKQQEALQYVPERPDKGMKGQYLYNLENSTPETGGFLESLFKPNPSNLGEEALAARPVDIRQLHTDGKAWSVGDGVGDAVAQKAGLADLSDLASTMAYPRLATVKDTRFAGTMGGQVKKLMDDGALRQVADDTLMGQEDGGLWVVMKRIERGAETAKPAIGKRQAYQFGPMKVRNGDQWLIGKTDKPGRFAPDAQKINDATTEAWAKYKDPLRQIATSNPFGQEFNLIQKVMAPEDWVAARQVSRGKWETQMGGKLSAMQKAEGMIADNAQIQQMAKKLYDIAAPKAFKMQKNAVYGRMYSLVEGGMRFADETLNKVMQGEVRFGSSIGRGLRGKDVTYAPHDGFRPVREVWNTLSDEERQLVVMAAHTQTPGKDLATLAASGRVSPNAVKAVEELQAINQHVLTKYIMPALEEAGMQGEYKWLEGYILPRIFKGDFMQRVVDEAGKPMWISSGATPAEAQKIAKAVVEEAAGEGKKWSTLEVESKAFKGVSDVDDMDAIYGMVHEQMGQSAEAQATVQKAMRRLLTEREGSPAPRAPNTMSKERTGIPGTPDVEHYSLEDVIKASENHYRQLLRYSAYHSWKHRFGDMAMKWGKSNETEYTDLMRKAGQWLGVEGQLTNQINKMLQPVLGNVLGPKAATKIAQGTNSLMYAWQLGIVNPTFALLNLLQPLQTTIPWISFMQNAPTHEASRMMQMHLRYDSAGKVAGSVGVLSPIKIMGRAVGMMGGGMPYELKQFYQQAIMDGTVAPQVYDEWIGSSARNVHSLREAAGRNGWEFIKETATLLSTRSEQFSRAMTFNATYVLGKEHFGLEGDALYRFMRKGTETTMYGYSVMDRSRVLTGPVGSMFGLFKNWQFHFIGQMAQYAGLGMKDGIWAPMLWQGGAALALGGLGATPLKMAADGLARMATDSPNAFYWLQENWNDTAADATYFGLPALLGISFQTSSMMPGTDITQDLSSLTNVVFMQRAQQAWKAIGGAADVWEGTGNNPLKDPNVRDSMLQAFAPRAMIRAFSSTEGDYIRSMGTGQPTVRDLSPAAKYLHAAGFNLTEIEKHYIVGSHLNAKREAIRDATQDLGNAFAQARVADDREAMTGIINRAVASGVSVPSVLRSANTRYHRETQGDHLSQYDKAEVARANKFLND